MTAAFDYFIHNFLFIYNFIVQIAACLVAYANKLCYNISQLIFQGRVRYHEFFQTVTR